MSFAACGRRTQSAQQLVNLLFIPRYKGPTIAGVEFPAPCLEPFGSVGGRIDADGNEANVSTCFLAQLFLHACESCAERRTDRRAGSKDVIDNDCVTFYEIRVETNLPSVLVEQFSIRNVQFRWRAHVVRRVDFGGRFLLLHTA